MIIIISYCLLSIDKPYLYHSTYGDFVNTPTTVNVPLSYIHSILPITIVKTTYLYSYIIRLSSMEIPFNFITIKGFKFLIRLYRYVPIHPLHLARRVLL
jgi:hypothetical protein